MNIHDFIGLVTINIEAGRPEVDVTINNGNFILALTDTLLDVWPGYSADARGARTVEVNVDQFKSAFAPGRISITAAPGVMIGLHNVCALFRYPTSGWYQSISGYSRFAIHELAPASPHDVHHS